MSVILDLTPAEEEVLSRDAAARRMNVADYIREKVFSAPLRPSPDGNRDPNGRVYSVSAALAVLEELGKPEYAVTNEEWDTFARGIDEARPGQRSVFGQGTNPESAA